METVCGRDCVGRGGGRGGDGAPRVLQLKMRRTVVRILYTRRLLYRMSRSIADRKLERDGAFYSSLLFIIIIYFKGVSPSLAYI